MDLKYLPLIIGKTIFLVINLLILIVCFNYIQIIYTNNILPDKLVKETFSQSFCAIVSKQLTKTGHIIHRYRASFLVNYMANNVKFESWTTGNGLDQSYFHDQKPQEAILAEFNVGNTYPCWYNPTSPQVVVLVLRHDWMSTLPLAVPSIIILMVAFYLLKSIYQLWGFLSLKAQEQKKRFKQ